jgi:hypothetical protein
VHISPFLSSSDAIDGPQWEVQASKARFHTCDRTTSEMSDLSPKIISGESRPSENTQTQHKKGMQYHIYEVKVNLLHISSMY